MNIRPLRDRVLVKRENAEHRAPGTLLFIPDSAKKQSQLGKILATGEGHYLENGEIRPLIVTSGDRVMFNMYAGTEIVIDGETLLLLKEEDILGIVTHDVKEVSGGGIEDTRDEA